MYVYVVISPLDVSEIEIMDTIDGCYFLLTCPPTLHEVCHIDNASGGQTRVRMHNTVLTSVMPSSW